MKGIAAGINALAMTGNSSGLLVIASVAKQSPTWNMYSNYYFLSAEIAALAMTGWIIRFRVTCHCERSEAIPYMEQVQQLLLSLG